MFLFLFDGPITGNESGSVGLKPNQVLFTSLSWGNNLLARRLLPQLNEVKSTWLGFRPTLPDSLPVIGPSKRNKNIIYAFGHQHIGWTLGAVTGKIINSICNDRVPNINIEPFSPSRFN